MALITISTRLLVSMRFYMLVLLLAQAAAGDEWYWTVPPPAGQSGIMLGNMDFVRGSSVTLVWYSNISTYNVALYQQHSSNVGGDFAGIIHTANNDGLGSVQFNWVVDPMNTNPSDSNVYYLYIGYPMANALGSHYFNIQPSSSKPSLSSTTLSAATSSITGGTASFITTAGNSIAISSTLSSRSASADSIQSSSTTSSTPVLPTYDSGGATVTSSNNQISGSTVIGLGVGLGVGVLAVSIIAILLYLKLKRRRQDQYATAAPYYADDKQYQQYSEWSSASQLSSAIEKEGKSVITLFHGVPQELSGKQLEPVELPARASKR